MLGFLTDMHPIILVRPKDRCDGLFINKIRHHVGERATFFGWCVTSRTLTTIKGQGMQFVTFEDETGIVETVLFPKVYTAFTRRILHQEAFRVWGKVCEDFGSVFVQVEGLAPVAARPPKASAVRSKRRKTADVGPMYVV